MLKLDIIECVSEKSKIYTDNLFHIFDKYIELEQFLLEKNILKSKSKRGYRELFSELFKSKQGDTVNINIYKKIITQVENSDMLLSPGVIEASFVCNGSLIKQNGLDNDNKYSNYYLDLKKAIDNFTIENQSAYFDLVENTPKNEFSDIIFRAPLLSIYIGALEYLTRIE